MGICAGGPYTALPAARRKGPLSEEGQAGIIDRPKPVCSKVGDWIRWHSSQRSGNTTSLIAFLIHTGKSLLYTHDTIQRSDQILMVKNRHNVH